MGEVANRAFRVGLTGITALSLTVAAVPASAAAEPVQVRPITMASSFSYGNPMKIAACWNLGDKSRMPVLEARGVSGVWEFAAQGRPADAPAMVGETPYVCPTDKPDMVFYDWTVNVAGTPIAGRIYERRLEVRDLLPPKQLFIDQSVTEQVPVDTLVTFSAAKRIKVPTCKKGKTRKVRNVKTTFNPAGAVAPVTVTTKVPVCKGRPKKIRKVRPSALVTIRSYETRTHQVQVPGEILPAVVGTQRMQSAFDSIDDASMDAAYRILCQMGFIENCALY